MSVFKTSETQVRFGGESLHVYDVAYTKTCNILGSSLVVSSYSISDDDFLDSSVISIPSVETAKAMRKALKDFIKAQESK